MELVLHPATALATVERIDAAVWRDDGRWHFRFLVDGVDELILPEPRRPERTDSLWKQTCFEAFVGLGGSRYIELNFSPSSQWAAYRFDDYRQGMREETAEVEVWIEGGETWIAVEAAVRCDVLSAGSVLGLSAVVEERDGKSYWALGHPNGAPDFHDRACFRALLADIAHT